MFLQTGDVGTSPDQPAPIHFNVLTEKNSLPMEIAMTEFRNDPNNKAWVSRMDKRNEFRALNQKYTQPVYTEFETFEKKSIKEARSSVADYTTKIEKDLDEKYSRINDLKSQLASIDKTVDERNDQFSEKSSEQSKLSREIERLKELKDAEE